MFGRRNLAILTAEFLGTGVLTLLILSVQRSTIGVPFFVALAAGLTLTLMTFALGVYASNYFNPAVTLALWTARKISTLNAVLAIFAQILGAYAAYLLYSYFVKTDLQDVGGQFSGRVLVAEAVGTGIFAFGVAAALWQRFSPAVSASVAGVAYMVGIVAASSASIGLLNPAVAFGVKAWVWGTYILGPVLGAIIGVNLYNLVFAERAVVSNAAAVATPVKADKAVASKSTAAKPARRKTTAKKKTTTRRKTTRRS
jgi:glycerol uptake facilitator-like aquaporin